jgi:polar amino acid transport system substrate-binding protein
VSFIGAGSFAGNFLLPHLSRLLPLESVLTSRPHTAEDARQKYSFVRACSELDSFLSDTSAAVAITTRHDTHALFAIRSLKAGKRVFVEKPLCLNMAEYKEIESLLQTPGTPDLMVGFNRRFAPLTQRLREKFKGLPMAINYRINAGVVPADHWVHDLEIGGGRIIGEACHFVDLCSFLARSPVEFVSAHTLKSSPQNGDTFAATLRFENGSVANISYFSNGNKALAKEHLEVFSGGVSAVMDDFKSLVNYGNKVEKHKLAKQDKGHAAEMDAFTKAVKSGDPFPITVRESLHATKATFAIVESISQGGVLIDVSSF